MPKRKRVDNDSSEADYFDLHDFLDFIKENKESEEMADLMAMFYNYKASKGEFKHPSKFIKKYCKDYISDITFIDGKDALRILKSNNSDPVKFIQFLDAVGDSISLTNPKHCKKFGKIIKDFKYEDIVNCFISFHNEFSLAVTFIDAINDFLKCFPEWNDENKTKFFEIFFLYPQHSYFLSHNKNQLSEAFPLLETIPKLGKIDEDLVVESDADENGNLKGFISSEDEELSDSDNDNKNKNKRTYIDGGDSDLFESMEEDNGNNNDDDEDDDLESVVVEEKSDENLSDLNQEEEDGNDEDDDNEEEDDDEGLAVNPFTEYSASESEENQDDDDDESIREKSTIQEITFL